jgi:DNA-binding CsgD family transcriptional regulator
LYSTAQGMSSREISTVSFVSVRTFESHLAAAYRKLDIQSRHHLRAALAALP